jgi:hypothetical protein
VAGVTEQPGHVPREAKLLIGGRRVAGARRDQGPPPGQGAAQRDGLPPALGGQLG